MSGKRWGVSLNPTVVLRVGLTFAVALLAVVACGCNSATSSRSEQGRTQSENQTLQTDFDPGAADFCQETMAQHPAEPFHFTSVRKHPGTSDSVWVKADVTPERIDVTNSTSMGTTTNHYQRRDKRGWTMAVTAMAMSSPWMDRDMAKFDMKKLGQEKVNGFDTVKYAVDTTNDSSDKLTYLQAMDLKDYNIVGSLWLTKDTGCILKYVIDDTDYNKSGAVSKTHYEGSVSKQ
jgi:hypothetical protein